MATPPIVANTDFQQWQSWQPVRTPAGDRTYYVIPGYNNQYVFDPYTSDATGRITIYQNPQPLYEAEQKAQAAKEDAGSTSSQLAGIGGTIAGAGTTYLIADAIAKPWAESTLGGWLSSGAKAGTGAGVGTTGGVGAGTTSAVTTGTTTVAPLVPSAATASAPAAVGAAPEILSAKFIPATSAPTAPVAALNPYAASIGFAIIAALMNKHGEKYVGDPVSGAMQKITGSKKATEITDESLLSAKDMLGRVIPGFDKLPVEQQDQAILAARQAAMIGFTRNENPNINFAELRQQMAADAEMDPAKRRAYEGLRSMQYQGRAAPRFDEPGPQFALKPAWTKSGFYQTLGSGSAANLYRRDAEVAKDLMDFGVAPQYRNVPGAGEMLDLNAMWSSIPLDQRIAINRAKLAEQDGDPTFRVAPAVNDQFEGFLQSLGTGVGEIAPAQKLQEGEGFSISKMPGETRTWDRESVGQLSKDEMADMLAQLMDGRFPKAGSPQPQIVPVRSSTLSPGIGKDGRRIVY